MRVKKDKIVAIAFTVIISTMLILCTGNYGIKKLKSFTKHSSIVNSSFQINQNETTEELSFLEDSSTQKTETSKFTKIYNLLDTIVFKINDISKTIIIKKSDISKCDTYISYFLTGHIFSSTVITGRENWLFYNGEKNGDGDSIRDFEGKNFYSREELSRINNILQNIKSSLLQKNIQLIFMIAPNKEQIYPEFMDKSYSYSSLSSSDQLIKYLKDNGINAVYPKEDLIKNKNIKPVYYAKDTHWNYVGGKIGTDLILKSLGIKYTDISDDNIIMINNNRISDLPHLTGLDKIFNNDEEYIVEGQFEFDVVSYLADEKNKTYTHLENPDAEIDKTVLIIGDSFRTGMLPHLAKTFKNVYVIHRDHYYTDLINESNPDFVIMEYVERYSHRLLEQGPLL